ncbi:FKBP-type peptidyl-prolyl cis-trans isomerase [Synoicihabitans lomoniglobus]|uniref:Peptidyl-prolyl cis-trans isomerase n=1 Tax=Synoicihabitans lomoniglobus TaxID=2909285 RepID=A0AAF0CRY5_9BACT|nr:FKBP-type peptidyl-prolyl cis-trans isomerase [Opitutaceae bacterium LMO-M01]WED66922.1 FKBP-type peptidyl-prolyl cis-trans isomerase [Opitutaceae bacterium LMO-M01]
MSEKPAATPAASTPAPTYTTTEQKVSYGIGRNIGADIARNAGFETDVEALVAGMRDSIGGAESQVPEAELQAAFVEIRAAAQAAAQEKAQVNKTAGEAFLAENAKRPEVTTTASGLQYEVITAGTGPKPTATNTVKVHYHGTLVDGTVFDSSVQRGEPIEFPVTGVIKGWIEGLQLMPTGSKWKFFIPSDLAYGDQDKGTIPPGSALIFDVELLEVK